MKRKRIAIIVAAVGVVAGLIAWQSIDTTGNDAGLAGTVLEVRGMSSLLCELDVRSTLAAIEGVADVSVNREEARAFVRYDPASGTPEAFVKAVEARGYGASVVEQDRHSHSASVTCDDPACCARSRKGTSLSREQISQVSDYVFSQLIATERIPSTDDILRATGIDVSREDIAALQQAVVARLAEDPRVRGCWRAADALVTRLVRFRASSRPRAGASLSFTSARRRRTDWSMQISVSRNSRRATCRTPR